MAKVRKDLTGAIFSRLTIVCRDRDHITPSGQCHAKWVVQRSCGSAPFSVMRTNLKRGNTKSCGCLQKEAASRVNMKHGLGGSREYKSWYSMIQRCTNPELREYTNYGGRGISVCQRWLESFEAFYEDMGERPEGMTLDRVDVNGDYEPENCRWTTVSQQGYNQRKRCSNTSGRTGVSWSNKSMRWVAQITKNRVQINLGHFYTFEEAVAAREVAELEYFGYNKN